MTTQLTMTKTAAIRTVIAAAATAPIVFTTGYACRIARAIADRPSHFYMTGSMGLALPIATGIAHTTGRPTVVVDGDGSLLMNPAALVTAGSLRPLPLVHILLDDGVHASTGGQATGADRVDVCGCAQACGYPTVSTVGNTDALAAFVASHLAECRGPVFARCRVGRSDEPVPGRVDLDLAGLARRFGAHLCTTDSAAEASLSIVDNYAPRATVWKSMPGDEDEYGRICLPTMRCVPWPAPDRNRWETTSLRRPPGAGIAQPFIPTRWVC